MNNGYSLEGADRLTVGTSDTTMLIWKHVEAAGEAGLSRDEIIVLVASNINAGYARRRYFKSRLRQHRRRVLRGSGVTLSTPSWDDTNVEAARSYVIQIIVRDMRKHGTLVRGDDGRYRVGRKPRYNRDERTLDVTGDRTRLHINGNEVLRVLRPACDRLRERPRAQLTSQEKVALYRLVELYEEALRAGFPNVA